MRAGDTLTVRGDGGAVSQLDVPPEGTPQRELLDDFIATGKYVVLSEGAEVPLGEQGELTGDGTGEALPPVDDGTVPDGTIDAVVDWVRGAPEDEEPADGWDLRALEALEAEQAKGDGARKTLVDLLERVLGNQED